MCSMLSVVFACISLVALLSGCNDTIVLQNASGEAGLLIDGVSRNGAVVNDRGLVRTGTGDFSVNVGRLTSAAVGLPECKTWAGTRLVRLSGVRE